MTNSDEQRKPLQPITKKIIAGVLAGATFLLVMYFFPGVLKRAKLPEAAPAAAAQSVTRYVPAARQHNYDVKDGVDYGYTAELSADQRQAGQVANNIVMFSYAGQRDGKHQVHSRQGNLFYAFECSVPCEVIKVLSVIDADGLRQEATVERLRATPTMIAAMALADAIHGELEEYAQYPDGDRKGRQLALWVDEQRGLTRTLIKKAK